MMVNVLCSELIYDVKLFISTTEKIDWGYGMEITEVVIIALNGQDFAEWLILTLLFHQTMKCSSDSSQTIVKFQRALRLGLKKVCFSKLIWNFSVIIFKVLVSLKAKYILYFVLSSLLWRNYNIQWNHFVSWTSTKLSTQRGLWMGHQIPWRRTNYAGICGIQFGICLSLQVSDMTLINYNHSTFNHNEPYQNIYLSNYFFLGGTIWMSEMDQMPLPLGLESDDAEAIYQPQ